MTFEELKEAIKGKSFEEIRDLTEKYQNQDKLEAHKLGEVYTPTEVVDFINNSIKDLLKIHFNKDLEDDDVEIIDPFAGPGTFFNNLFDKIEPEALDKKIINKDIQAYEYNEDTTEIANIVLQNKLKEKKCKSIFEVTTTDTFKLYDTFTDEEPELLTKKRKNKW